MAINGLKLQVQKRKQMAWIIKNEYDNKDWVLPDLNTIDSDTIKKAKKIVPEFFEKYYKEI